MFMPEFLARGVLIAQSAATAPPAAVSTAVLSAVQFGLRERQPAVYRNRSLASLAKGFLCSYQTDANYPSPHRRLCCATRTNALADAGPDAGPLRLLALAAEL